VLVAGSLPLRLQPLGVNPTAPFSFTLALSQLDLSQFSALAAGPQTKLGGTLDGRLSIEGTTRAPRIAGNVALVNGSYVSNLDRAGITQANARLTFHGTSVALEVLHANVGGGTLDGSGQLDLPFPGAHTSGYSISLTANAARIDNPQYGRGTIDGMLTLAAGPTMPILSGNVTLSNTSIPFTAISRAGSGGGPAGALPFDLAFNVVATAGRKVRVQSSFLDIGATGTLDLTGTLSSPRLAGMLTATPGGVFSTYNRAFRVQQATVRFDPAQGVVPYIELRAYAHVTNPDPNPARNVVGSADITVTVQGPADELAQGTGIVFSSSPSYSQEQIIGLLLDASLFGAVNFAQQANGTTLRGAPGESNALLPPGATPYQTGVISFNQEAFSILNSQLTQRFLTPIERPLIDTLGLADLEITVDYGGGVGYTILKQIGHRDLYASFGQTLSFPVRTLVGFTARPNATTSIDFNYFVQKFSPAIVTSGPFNTIERVNGIQPLTGRTGFTFNIVRKYP
jgi:autotransporter translocation and assembly factor TamB